MVVEFLSQQSILSLMVTCKKFARIGLAPLYTDICIKSKFRMDNDNIYGFMTNSRRLETLVRSLLLYPARRKMVRRLELQLYKDGGSEEMDLLTDLKSLLDHVNSLGVSEPLKLIWKQALRSGKSEALHALALVLLPDLQKLGVAILHSNGSYKSILGPLIQECAERRDTALPEWRSLTKIRIETPKPLLPLINHSFPRSLHLLPSLQSLTSGSVFQSFPALGSISTLRTLRYDAARLNMWNPGYHFMLPALAYHTRLENLFLLNLVDDKRLMIVAYPICIQPWPGRHSLQHLTIFRKPEEGEHLEYEKPVTYPQRSSTFNLAYHLRYGMTDLKLLCVDAYFFLGGQVPSLSYPNQEHKILPMLGPTIKSVYIKDITRDTVSLFWSWLKAVNASKLRGELPNLRRITYSFIEIVKRYYPIAVIKANVFLSCPRDIVGALSSAGIDLQFKRISKAVVRLDKLCHQDLKYFRLDDGRSNKDKNMKDDDDKEELSILDLIDDNSPFNDFKKDEPRSGLELISNEGCA